MNVLVTGVTGYVGARLVPRLQNDGHAVRGFARRPLELGIPVVRGDAVTGDGLDEALDGIDVAYFLIHSMERSIERPVQPPRADRGRELRRRGARRRGAADRLPGRTPARRRSGLASPGEPPRGREDPPRGLAVHGRVPGLDRDRRPLAFVPLPRAPGRADARARRPGVGPEPHGSDRRARHGRAARARERRAGDELCGESLDIGGPDVVTYARADRQHPRAHARLASDAEAAPPHRSPRSPAGSRPRSPARTRR